MASVKSRIELTVPVKDEPGQLTHILSLVSKSGVNLLAFCGYATGSGRGEVLLVPDHDGKAKKALEAAGYEYKENSVVAVPAVAGSGAGAKLADRLSSRGINVRYAYASAAPDGRSTAIFRVENGDVDRAVKALG